MFYFGSVAKGDLATSTNDSTSQIKACSRNHQHEVMMWEKKRKAGKSSGEWLTVIKSHFNLSKKKM